MTDYSSMFWFSSQFVLCFAGCFKYFLRSICQLYKYPQIVLPILRLCDILESWQSPNVPYQYQYQYQYNGFTSQSSLLGFDKWYTLLGEIAFKCKLCKNGVMLFNISHLSGTNLYCTYKKKEKEFALLSSWSSVGIYLTWIVAILNSGRC